MRSSRTPAIPAATTTGLIVAAGLHVAWGLGSNFPYKSSAEFVDKIVGTKRRPSRRDCFAVAVALSLAGVFTAVPARTTLHQRMLDVLTAAFAIRATLGFTDGTQLFGLGGITPAFRTRDHYIYAPICAALAIGINTTRRHARTDSRW